MKHIQGLLVSYYKDKEILDFFHKLNENKKGKFILKSSLIKMNKPKLGCEQLLGYKSKDVFCDKYASCIILPKIKIFDPKITKYTPVTYTHHRAHETSV